MLFYLFIFLPWGAKTATVAKLRGLFCGFFLRGPKSQLWKSWGAKTAIKPNLIDQIIDILFREIINIIFLLMFYIFLWFTSSIKNCNMV